MMKRLSGYFVWKRNELGELRTGSLRGLMSAFSSLKVRNFRLYFTGQCFSLCGRWIQSIAMSWLVYRLTGSVMMLTTVAFINQIPTLLLAPLAGVLSDRYDRFRILVGTQTALMCVAFLLGGLAVTDAIRVWHVMVISFFSGIASAIEAPARQSFYSKLVPPQSLTNAIALNSVTVNGSRFIGPAIGGVLISLVGEGYCFIINGISFIPVLVALFMMRLDPYRPSGVRRSMLEEFRSGFDYVKGYLPLKAVIVCVGVISFFGMPFVNVVPALVKGTLGGDSILLGYVNSAIGAGAVTAAFYLAARHKIRGLGKVLTITGLLLGIGFMSIAFVKIPVVAIVIAYPIGCALIGTLATSNTLLQSLVDDDMRGRVMSFFTMASAGLNPLGGLFYGWIAERTSLTAVIFGSGIICVVTACVYEYYRPRVRAATLERMSDSGIVPEIANAIDDRNPF